MVERHDVTSLGERRDRVGVVVGAPADVAAAAGRRLRRAGGQHAQPDAEGERRLLGHPGQLPAADHPDDREPLGRGRPDPGSGAGLGTVRHGQNTIGSRSALSWARVGSGRVGAPMSTAVPEPASGTRRPGPARPGRRVGPDLQLRAPADRQLHPRAVDPAGLHRRHGHRAQDAPSTATPSLGRLWQVLGPDPQRDRLLLHLRRPAADQQGRRELPGVPDHRGLHLHLHPARGDRRDEGDRQQPRASSGPSTSPAPSCRWR